jgi:hypothetical protein
LTERGQGQELLRRGASPLLGAHRAGIPIRPAKNGHPNTREPENRHPSLLGSAPGLPRERRPVVFSSNGRHRGMALWRPSYG